MIRVEKDGRILVIRPPVDDRGGRPILPIVHSNGTPLADLIEQREAAYRATRAALDALRAAAPNGRDYYPEPGLFEKAVAQHEARASALQNVYDGLEAELMALQDIEWERSR